MLVGTKERRRPKAKARTPAGAVADISLKNDRLVGTTEAAQLLGLTGKTLREWRSKRTGPAALKMGSGRQGRVLYRLSALEAWVRANVVEVKGS